MTGLKSSSGPFPPKPCCDSMPAFPELTGGGSWIILGSTLAAQQFYLQTEGQVTYSPQNMQK